MYKSLVCGKLKNKQLEAALSTYPVSNWSR